MPYEIRKSGSKFCVHKEGGAQVACHSTRKEALQQMKALYANEKADLASMQIGCDSCERAFLSDEAYLQHAEAVHGDSAREFSGTERKKAASSGAARSDGSFPIKTVADLKNAIKAYGRAKDKAAAKAHIIKRAKALGATNLLPDGWLNEKAEAVKCDPCDREFLSERAMSQHQAAVHGEVERDLAAHQPNGHVGSSHVASLGCDRCNRAFFSVQGLKDHASEVHDKALDANNTTYSDKEQLVRKALQEKLTGSAYSRVWCWIADMTDAWVVYSVEGSDNLQKATYTIADDNTVTIGDPETVRRATVYEKVGA